MKTGNVQRGKNKFLLLLAGWTIGAASAVLCQGNSMPGNSGPAAAAADAKLPDFEVASVKPSNPGEGEINGFYTYPGGRVVGNGCTLQYLIMVAFDVQPFQVSGGPSWAGLVGGDRYDIQAIPPASSQSSHSNPALHKNPPNEEQRQMLQSLLIERFQLKFHRETREGSVYLLMRGDKELKLQTPKDKNAYSWAGGITGGWYGGGIRGENISMPQLAERLSSRLERPVLDQTGLNGSFDFEYRTGDENNDADITGFLLASMKELGLKLTSAKGPVEAIVIDHVERPSPN